MKKKILSLMLAMVMMLSLSVTALADNTVETTEYGSYTDSNDNSYSDASSVSFTKSFVLTNGGTSPAETFTFTIVELDKTDSGEAYKYTGQRVLPTVGSATFAEGDAETENGTEETGTKTVKITLPAASEYPSVGVYSYKITENTTKQDGTIDAGVNYNTEGDQYLLVVSIVNGTVYNEEKQEDEETLVRIVALWSLDENGDKKEKVDGSDNTTYVTGADFTNTYTANSLSVTKTVEGAYGDKTKEFKFTVTFACSTEGVNFNGDVISIAEGSGATPVGGGWNESHTIYTFTLSDGDTITFENVPKGVTYTVDEDDYTSEGYTTTGEVTEGEMNNSDVKVEVTNTKEGDIDTGISLDSLPYILMLIVVAAGVVVMISRRRLDDRF